MHKTKPNIILGTDSYKLTHHLQSISGLSRLYSYGESRTGSRFPTISWFGLQMILIDHFLDRVTNEMIDEAEEECVYNLGFKQYFNRSAWERVRDLGYLPIEIKALPEGMEVPISNALFTLESTEDWFATSLNSLESLLMHTWMPTTIATNCLYIKRGIQPFIEKSSDSPDMAVAVNDFGFRGATGDQHAGRGGAAHLVHFRGSDNLQACRFVRDYYGMRGRGISVYATEHSTATSFGPGRGEVDYVLHQLTTVPNNGILSVVGDSYDYYGFVRNVLTHEEVMPLIEEREGRFVVRPDSGKPNLIVADTLDMLGESFGYEHNRKGYKVLNHNVGAIQGDGMENETIIDLHKHITNLSWSTDNFVTGSGGGLLQKGFDRDVQRFAVKAAEGDRVLPNGETLTFNIQKNPKTDMSKASKTGHLWVHDVDGKIVTDTINRSTYDSTQDLLKTVLRNGNLNAKHFEEIINFAQI